MATATVTLTSIGAVPAVPLSEVQAGDTLVWNFSQTSEVASITRVTAKTIELTTRSKDGTLWTQRKRSNTLVARIAQ